MKKITLTLEVLTNEPDNELDKFSKALIDGIHEYLSAEQPDFRLANVEISYATNHKNQELPKEEKIVEMCYYEDINTLEINAKESDFHPKYLQYMLEAKKIPKDAKLKFLK
jgi:hypothetical protein